jgi:hypothetical protein
LSTDEGGTVCIWNKLTGKEEWRKKFEKGVWNCKILDEN